MNFIQTPPSLALSVRQPWAWAIIHAGKDIENRSWQAVNRGLSRRGEVAIHASKGMTQAEYHEASEFMASIGVECPAAHELARGAVIGVVEIIDVVRESASPWFFGPRGLVLRNPREYTPLPCAGALGFFNWQERRRGDLETPAKWMLPEQSKPEPQGSLI